MIADVKGLNGVLRTDKDDIPMEFLEYFKSRWASDPTMVSVWHLVWSTIEEKVSVKDNAELCRPVTIDDIKTIFWLMSASKGLVQIGFLDTFTSTIGRSSRVMLVMAIQ